MPRLLQIMIDTNFKKNGEVEILRTEISEKGCVLLGDVAERHDISVDRLKEVFTAMHGVTCIDGRCCVTDLQEFSSRMKIMAVDE